MKVRLPFLVSKKEKEMVCKSCGKEIGKPYLPAYQVRVGYVEDDGVTFIPDEDIGYFCSECLMKGV